MIIEKVKNHPKGFNKTVTRLTRGTQRHLTQPKSSLSPIYAKFGAKFSDIEKQRLFFNYVFPRENSLQYKQHGGETG